MRFCNTKRIGLLLVLAFIVCTGFECGKPTEPPIITDSDYPVYFRKDDTNNDSINYIHRYFPGTNELDSILIPINYLFFEVKLDEKELLLHNNENTYVYNIHQHKITSTLPFFGNISYSPDSQLISISDGTELNIIDANTYTLLHKDTTNIASSVFTKDNKKLFCFKSDSPNLLILDRENNYAKTDYQIDVLEGRPIPSFDGSKIFVLKNVNWDASLFVVYDLSLDSIIFSDDHSPGHGLMTISPDGKYVSYTNPGTLFHGTPPPFQLNVYDVEKKVLSFIETLNFQGPEIDSLNWVIPQEVAFTADGKWLTAIGNNGYIIAINFETMTITNSKKVTQWYQSWWNLTSSVLPPQL